METRVKSTSMVCTSRKPLITLTKQSRTLAEELNLRFDSLSVCVSLLHDIPGSRSLTGQGKHSEGGIPRLKPEVQEDLQS